MKRHGEDALRARHLGAGTNEAAEAEGVVAAESQRFARDSARGHVVAERFHAVDVRHDTVTVVQASFVGSHSAQAGELLAEELRAACRGRRLRTEGDGGPGVVVVAVGGPGVGDCARHLPLGILRDSVVKGQGVHLAGLGDHHVLEEQIAVETADGQPSTGSPGVVGTIAQLQLVLVVRALREAVLERLLLLIHKGAALGNDSGAASDLKGLLVGVRLAHLGYLDIHFIALASETAH